MNSEVSQPDNNNINTHFNVFFSLHTGERMKRDMQDEHAAHQRLKSLMEWRPPLPLLNGHYWPRWCVT